LGGRGSNRVFSQAHPGPSLYSGLKWGIHWALHQWGLFPAGVPAERSLCPTLGASMSCTDYAKVRTWHLGGSCGRGRGGEGLECRCPVMGAERGRSQLGHPMSGRVRCPNEVEHFHAGLERRSFPPVLRMGLKGETTSLGRDSLSVLIPSLPPPLQMYSQHRWRE
jgi:hypothetical protein